MMHTTFSYIPFRILCCLFLATYTATGHGQQSEQQSAIEFVGTLRKTIGQGENPLIYNHDFIWHQVDDGRWHLTLQGLNSKEVAYIGSEGGFIYSLQEAPYVDSDRIGVAASIAPDSSHISSSHLSYILWLALQAGRTSDSTRFATLPSPGQGPGMPISYIYEARVRRHSAQDSLLEHIEWHLIPERLNYGALAAHPAVPIIYSEDVANHLRDELKALRKHLWRKVDSVYRIVDVGESEGIVYPARFEVLHLGFDRKRPDESFARLEGIITGIRSVPAQDSMLPHITQPSVSVNDLRYAHKQGNVGTHGLRYKLPGTQWITSTNHPFLQNQLSISSLSVIGVDPRPEWHSWSSQIVLVLAFAIPALLFARSRLRRRVSK